jgi:hypothetical protein
MSHGQILSGQLSMVTSDARNDSFGRNDLGLSPPGSEGTTSTGIAGDQGPTRR